MDYPRGRIYELGEMSLGFIQRQICCDGEGCGPKNKGETIRSSASPDGRADLFHDLKLHKTLTDYSFRIKERPGLVSCSTSWKISTFFPPLRAT